MRFRFLDKIYIIDDITICGVHTPSMEEYLLTQSLFAPAVSLQIQLALETIGFLVFKRTNKKYWVVLESLEECSLFYSHGLASIYKVQIKEIGDDFFRCSGSVVGKIRISKIPAASLFDINELSAFLNNLHS